jgi:hypothetical protein
LRASIEKMETALRRIANGVLCCPGPGIAHTRCRRRSSADRQRRPAPIGKQGLLGRQSEVEKQLNHLNVAYAPTSQIADHALAAKAAMMADLGIVSIFVEIDPERT